MNNCYYVAQKDKLMTQFDKASNGYRPHLIRRYGPDPGNAIGREARIEYENLIPQIPFIGGPQVHMTEDLMESVQVLAYLRVLKAHGKEIGECKEIIYGAVKTRLSQYPRFVLWLGGVRAFSQFFVKSLQRQAQESHQRKYPGGFVFDIVVGDGKEFDWGLDFTECGICKFYHAQNASEFLPLVCSIDYVLSDALGYGLVRTETLAEGARRCNPRMKRGKPTQWRVPAE